MHESVLGWLESDEASFPFAIDCSVEDSPLGTGGAIALALGHTSGGKVLILNGDTLFNADLDAFFSSVTAPVGMALREVSETSRYGRVELSGSAVTVFGEKRSSGPGLINAGIYVLDPEASSFAVFASGRGAFSFERDFLETVAVERGILSGTVCNGYFIDIGVPEDYARASRELPYLSRVRLLKKQVAEACGGREGMSLFLDRDGVVNVLRPGDYVKTWQEFEFIPGIVEAIAGWSRMFRHIILVTNQRGVGRGLMTEESLADIHARMKGVVEKAGGRIDAVYSCTSADLDDPMRKPRPGMFFKAMQDFPDIRPSECIMAGDSESDREFASACGIRFIKF